ncbi:MAG: flagellar filament capping protein FliD [Clostridium butyricum]|nr:flagellar filament capping protein FliD [Clostridium butyricum]
MRITGLATGLDMDEIIKNSMKPYRIKVDQMTQKRDVVEIKQKLYRDIMSDATKFYDKYFDITKSDSLLLSSNYKSVSFTSSSDSVKVTAGSDAKVGNYTVTGSAATAAKATITDTNQIKDGCKIVVNGKEFTLKGETTKEREKDLNNKLKEAGINVTARFSDFAGTDSENASGLILESTVLGSSGTFTVGNISTNPVLGAEISVGENATPTIITGFKLSEIKSNGKIIVNGKEIDLGVDNTTSDEEALKKLTEKLSGEGIVVSTGKKGDDINYEDIIFTSATSGEENPISVNVGGKIEADKTVSGGNSGITSNGTNATNTTVKFNKSELKEGAYVIDGNTVKIDLSKAVGKEQEYLKDLFEKNKIGVTVTVDDVKGEIVLKSRETGASSNFKVEKIDTTSLTGTEVKPGNDSTIKIVDDKGGVYKPDGTANTVTLDGVTFTFSGNIPTDAPVKITGKNDITETKDKLVNFINDYNTLIEKLNTLTSTKHDKSYTPLTADQKKEMSETEIKLWNERVEKGQLYKDSTLTSITNSLKSTMRTVMEGSGLNLEKIGINPSKDYSGNKNGTFNIDESKLTKALEDDIEGVMNLFIGKPEEGDKTTPEYTSKTGILHQLKDTLYKEFKTSSSTLSNKVGLEGTSTFSNNELTKSISDYENKIKDMEKDFTRREQALYSKYATLEKMMNNLNAQQSNLMSQLGMS